MISRILPVLKMITTIQCLSRQLLEEVAGGFGADESGGSLAGLANRSHYMEVSWNDRTPSSHPF